MDTIAGVDSSAAHDLCPQSAPMTQTVFDTFARQRFQMAARLAQANPSEHGLTYSEFLPDPDGPMTARASPFSTFKVRSRRTGSGPLRVG